jgi:hypothetical protein
MDLVPTWVAPTSEVEKKGIQSLWNVHKVGHFPT